MKQILCEAPVIIRNPRLQSLLVHAGSYSTPRGVVTLSEFDRALYAANFPKWRFSPKKLGVSHETLGQYYVFDYETGVCWPMFIEVPCGHCILCKDKKTRDWKFRALCESITSDNSTYFVTLTYNPKYFPSRGVHKEAVQLFMKRLRIKLSRLGIEHNIKYFAVGEYGKDSKRPHYHLLLWNFPDNDKVHFPNITAVLHFIEECWSTYKRDENGVWIYPKGSRTPARDPLGFCYCEPCDKGAYGYVMKYMRKSITPPPGMNPTFYLSSKFIGAAYAMQYKDFYAKHPEHLEISAFDPLLGETVTVPLPAYFVNKYMPCTSRLVPKSLRDAFSLYLDLLNKRFTLVVSVLNYGSTENLEEFPYLTPGERQVLDMYYPLIHRCEFSRLTCNEFEFHRFFSLPYSDFCDAYYSYTLELDTLESVLRLGYSEIDSKALLKSFADKEKRADSCEDWFSKRPPIDVTELAWQKRNRLERSRANEIL